MDDFDHLLARLEALEGKEARLAEATAAAGAAAAADHAAAAATEAEVRPLFLEVLGMENCAAALSLQAAEDGAVAHGAACRLRAAARLRADLEPSAGAHGRLVTAAVVALNTSLAADLGTRARCGAARAAELADGVRGKCRAAGDGLEKLGALEKRLTAESVRDAAAADANDRKRALLDEQVARSGDFAAALRAAEHRLGKAEARNGTLRAARASSRRC